MRKVRDASGNVRVYCTHGITDNVDVRTKVDIRGSASHKKFYSYFCRDHNQYGTYTITEPTPTLG